MTASAVPFAVSVKAVAQTEPLFVTPNPAQFGMVEVQQALDLSIDATNSSGGPLTVTTVYVEPGEFSITYDDCGDDPLDPGETCAVGVVFRPTETREYTGSIAFSTDRGSVTATLHGTGVPPSLTSTTTSAPATSPSQVPSSESTVAPVPTGGDGDGPTTTAGLPADSPAAEVPDEQRLEDCERRARDAEVAYEPTREMTVRETAQIRVTARIAGFSGATTTTVQGSSTTIVAVSLRCEVQVQLRGQDFEIDPADFQQGSFLDRPTITWSWDVQPLKAGDGILTLEIRSVAEIEGRVIEGAGGELYMSTIDVRAKPESRWAKVERWSGEIVDHPLIRGFGSLLLIGGTLAALWRKLLKRPWPWTKPSRAGPSGGTAPPP